MVGTRQAGRKSAATKLTVLGGKVKNTIMCFFTKALLKGLCGL